MAWPAGKLGAHLEHCRNLTPEAVEKGRERSVEVRREVARDEYSDLLPIIQKLREKGLTLQAIDELTAQGHVSRRGKPWNPMQVARVLSRADAA